MINKEFKTILLCLFAWFALCLAGSFISIYAADNVFTDDVGIGTSDPDAKLHLTGGAFLQTISSGPTYVGSVATGRTTDIYVSGKYAYVATGWDDELKIVDISNPSSPTVVGTFAHSLIENAAGAPFAASGYVYMKGTDSLLIIDVSNPSSPSLVGYCTDATNLAGAASVYVSGRYAYLGTSTGSPDYGWLAVVDISDPASPSYVARSPATFRVDSVFVNSRYAYLAIDTNQWSFRILDISDPSSPSIVSDLGEYPGLGSGKDIYVSGRYAYLAANTNFTVIDVSDPDSPTIKGTYAIDSDSVYVSGKYAYLGCPSDDTIRVLDISNPSSPSLVASYSNASYYNADSYDHIFVSGKYLYAGSNTPNYLLVLDITGIDSPGANIGDISASSIEVTDNVDIGNNLYVRSGLNVGPGGILSNGPLSAGGGGYFGDKVGIGSIDPDYDLTIDGNLGILDASTSFYTIFEGATQGVDITYTLPTDDGDSAEGLVTDGSGVLRWDTVAASLPSGSVSETMRHNGTTWVASDLLFNNTTNIGIGDTSPASLLTVGNGDLFQVNSSGELALSVNTATTAITGTQAGVGDILNLNNSSDEVFTILASGNVGIGVTAPGVALEIGDATGTLADGAGDLLVAGDAEIDGELQLDGGGIATSVATAWDLADTQTQALNIESGLLNFDTDNSRVGIGITSPDEKLHLTGGAFMASPTNPQVVGGASLSLPNLARGIYVLGKYAYIVFSNTGTDTFRIVDVSDPTSPEVVGGGSLSLPDNPIGIYVAGNYAYVTCNEVDPGTDAFRIIDISNPYSPAVVGGASLSLPRRAYHVYVSGRYAYVTFAYGTAGTDIFRIIDVSDPTSPEVVGGGSLSLPATATGVYVLGNYAYLCFDNSGSADSFKIVDISDPASPTIVGSVSSGIYGYSSSIYVSGAYTYLQGYGSGTNSLRIIDVSDPANPAVVGGGSLSLPSAGHGIQVSGRYAYSGFNEDNGTNLFRIVDVSDPTNPFVVGGTALSLPDYARLPFVRGRYVYLVFRNSTANSQFRIIDLNGIDSPGGNIGDISTAKLEATENMDVGNNLYVRSGLNVGSGGILSNGPLSVGEGGYFGNNVGIKAIEPDYDLTVDGNLGILDASTSYYTIFQGGDQTIFASDITYTLPTDDGDSGEALITDGSGVLSWGSPSLPSGTVSQTLRHNGSAWVANDLLFNTTTAIGIGDTSPAALLTVGDGDLFQVNSSGAIAAAEGITSSGTITFSGLSTDGPVIVASGVLGSEGQLATLRGGTGQDFSSTVQGNTLYFSGAGTMAALGPGTSGQYLKTQGASQNPVWDYSGNTTGPTLIVAADDSNDKTKADYVCDGTSDEEQIEDAIQGLETTGGTVLLLDGTYNISTTINVADSSGNALSNISLVGSGRGTILFLTNSADCTVVQAGDGGTTTVTGVTIANLQVDGNKANNTSGNGIVFNQDVHQSRIQNTWVHDFDNTGILLSGASGEENTYNLIQGNDVRTSSDSGILLTRSSYNIISGNICQGNIDNGIMVTTNSYYNTVENNVCRNTTGEGIQMYGTASRNAIIGNVSADNSSIGIKFNYSSSYNIVFGNKVHNNTHGIRLNASSNYNIISSNDITDSTTYDIWVRSTESNCTNNYLIGNRYSGTFLDDGTNVNNTVQHRDEFEVDGTLKAAQFANDTYTDSGVTLDSDDFGKTITIDSSSTQTVNLPSVGSTDIGAWYRIVKVGTGQVTIDAADSDTIADSSAGGTIYNDQTGQDYATITIQLVTETEWVIIKAHGTWITS
ncbi:NosD domain-containing protein [Candidatus Omnitrophota bacterium]